MTMLAIGKLSQNSLLFWICVVFVVLIIVLVVVLVLVVLLWLGVLLLFVLLVLVLGEGLLGFVVVLLAVAVVVLLLLLSIVLVIPLIVLISIDLLLLVRAQDLAWVVPLHGVAPLVLGLCKLKLLLYQVVPKLQVRVHRFLLWQHVQILALVFVGLPVVVLLVLVLVGVELAGVRGHYEDGEGNLGRVLLADVSDVEVEDVNDFEKLAGEAGAWTSLHVLILNRKGRH